MTDAGILTPPHAPMHDMLGVAGMLKPVEEEFIVQRPKHHHHSRKHEGEVTVDVLNEQIPAYAKHYTHDDGDDDSFGTHSYTAPAPEILADMHRKEHFAMQKAIEDDFASKLMDYKTK